MYTVCIQKILNTYTEYTVCTQKILNTYTEYNVYSMYTGDTEDIH